jgi:hypothetical protein
MSRRLASKTNGAQTPASRSLSFRGNAKMRMPHQLRAVVIGLIALVGAIVSSAAHADSGTVRITVLKAGWFIGGSGGSGILIFHGRRYPLAIGGLSAGLVFGAS